MDPEQNPPAPAPVENPELIAAKKTIRERETRIAELEDENKTLRRQLFESNQRPAPPAKKESDWGLPDYFNKKP